jgi:hypothetical protein
MSWCSGEDHRVGTKPAEPLLFVTTSCQPVRHRAEFRIFQLPNQSHALQPVRDKILVALG